MLLQKSPICNRGSPQLHQPPRGNRPNIRDLSIVASGSPRAVGAPTAFSTTCLSASGLVPGSCLIVGRHPYRRVPRSTPDAAPPNQIREIFL